MCVTRVINLRAPKCGSLADFLDWWVESSQRSTSSAVAVDLTELSSGLREAARSIVAASGYRCHGDRLELSGREFSTVIISETVFADIEDRSEVLERFIGFYGLTLKSIAAQEVVYDAMHIHFTYISIDKVKETLTLACLINDLNRTSPFSELRLVCFRHPEEGYPESANGHVDQRFTPSRFHGRPKVLLQRAINSLRGQGVLSASLFLRCAIDDDDVWLPWAMNEFTLTARTLMSRDGRDCRAIGFPNQFLWYPIDLGRVDAVPMRVVMTGSKCFVARNWEKISELQPWGLPESFSANMQRTFRRQGVDLVVARNNRASWLYMRRAGRLSSMTKYEHYLEEPVTRNHVGNEWFALAAACKIDRESFKRGEMIFEIDPPALVARAVLEEPRRLRIQVNLDEMCAAYKLDENDLEVVIDYGTNAGRDRIVLPAAAQLEVDPEGWTQRSGLKLISRGQRLEFSAWIRGAESYLS